MDDACVAVVSVRLVLYSAVKISDYFVEFTGFENELEFWLGSSKIYMINTNPEQNFTIFLKNVSNLQLHISDYKSDI